MYGRPARAAGAGHLAPAGSCPSSPLTTLALVAWMGLVRAAFGRVVPLGQAPAATILEIARGVRGPRCAAGSTRTSAQDPRLRGARAARLRRRRGHRPRARARARRARRRPPRRRPPGAARRRRRDDRGPRLPAAGRLEARLRRPRLPAALGRRRADRRAAARSIGSIVLFSRGRRSPSPTATARSPASSAQLVSTEVLLGELDLHARATASAELAAVQAQIEPHFLFNALNTIAAFCRTQPEEARRLVLSFADYCRWSLRRPAAFVDLRDELRPRRGLPRARARALRRPARGRRARRALGRARPWCRRSSCSRWSRTPSSTARPTGRCASSCAARCASAGCASRCATTAAASRASSPTA